MTDTKKFNDNYKNILYTNIVLLCRNKLFYTKFDLIDTFQNRIYLIFIHISFIFIKIKQDNKNSIYKKFYQNIFDLIFNKIELDMRESGYGDTTINKNMRFLVKVFYDILLDCEKYNKMNITQKKMFVSKFLKFKNIKKNDINEGIIDYFDKYEAFCFDLSFNSVLKGYLNFKY